VYRPTSEIRGVVVLRKVHASKSNQNERYDKTWKDDEDKGGKNIVIKKTYYTSS